MELNLRKYNKIGIMGGTFDPIHNQHLFIANTALEKLNLDIVLFIPTGKVPHKNNLQITDKNHRYNMTSLAINDNDKFIISDIETNNDDTNYTFQTLQKLREKTEAKFYFIVGIDTLFSLHTWRNLDIVSSLCSIVTFKRPDYEESTKNKEVIEKHNLEIISIDDVSLSLSSTEIRRKLLNGESIKYIVPDSVIHYAQKHNLYKRYYNDELIETIENDLKNILSDYRFTHTMSVLTLSKQLALHYDADVKQITICSLLHDYAKEMSKEEKFQYLDKNNLYIDEFVKNNIELSHGIIAKDIANKKYGITDIDMLNAIEYHTTGRPNMSILEKLLFLADSLEPNRKYDEVPELTKLAFTDIDKAIVNCIKVKLDYTKKTEKQEHPLGATAYDYYSKLIKERTNG